MQIYLCPYIVIPIILKHMVQKPMFWEYIEIKQILKLQKENEVIF